MNEFEINEILDFINLKYNEQNTIVKTVVGMASNKIETFQLDDWPASLRSCTIEELIMILKVAHQQRKLNF